MNMKDRFSENSKNYLKYRPGYPPELLGFLQGILSGKNRAWDCGTGNGQVAAKLADFFEEVHATDISVSQLMNAISRSNIHYTRQKAEKTNFPDSFFDLVTAAQAIHWFDFEAFYKEVRRTLKPGGLMAVMGYGLFRSTDATNEVIDRFYREVVGPYWDEERKYLEGNYQNIRFPFRELETPKFELRVAWSLERLIGYLNTWSAVKSYEKTKGVNPVKLIEKELETSFGKRNEIVFPILFRVGYNQE